MFSEENKTTNWPKIITLAVAAVMFVIFAPLTALSLFFMLIGLEC